MAASSLDRAAPTPAIQDSASVAAANADVLAASQARTHSQTRPLAFCSRSLRCVAVNDRRALCPANAFWVVAAALQKGTVRPGDTSTLGLARQSGQTDALVSQVRLPFAEQRTHVMTL